jgi:predicted SAM-dependent methyltransferase
MAAPATTGFRRRVLRVPGARRAVDAVYRARNEVRRRQRIRRDTVKLERLSSDRRDLRLNIGASGNHLEGWLSLDLRPDEVCLGMDAARTWPIASGSAEAINSEHFIEHLTLDQARRYFAEAFRVLAPGGLIRTTTPNLRRLAELYLAGEESSLSIHRADGYRATTHADMLNNFFYCWEHRHLHDFDGLAHLLREAGFVRVTEAAYGHSEHPLLHGIDRHEPDGLDGAILCVDAVRRA